MNLHQWDRIGCYLYHISASYGSTLDLQRSIKVSHNGVIDEGLSKGHLGLHIHEMDRLVSCFERIMTLLSSAFLWKLSRRKVSFL